MGMEFWSRDLWPRSHGFDLVTILDSVMSMVLVPTNLICIPQGIGANGHQHFAPVTFCLGDMTLTMCISDVDGYTPCATIDNFVSFPVIHCFLFITETILWEWTSEEVFDFALWKQISIFSLYGLETVTLILKFLGHFLYPWHSSYPLQIWFAHYYSFITDVLFCFLQYHDVEGTSSLAVHQ